MSNAPTKHAIALVDDHTLFRKGLIGLIASLGDYEVVLEAANGRDFQREVMRNPGVSIALVDLHMPVMDGYETLAWIRDAQPGLMAVALTFEHSESAVIRAMRAGARGFLPKDIEPDVLKTALDAIRTTGYYHTELVQNGIFSSMAGRTAEEYERERIRAMITDREMEFLRLVCSEEEPTYEHIADSMEVHRRTVDGYRQALFDKFRIRSKTGLVLFAIKWGFVTV